MASIIREGKINQINSLIQTGTKVGLHHVREIPAGGETVIRLRFARAGSPVDFRDFDEVVDRRRAECDEFNG